MKIFFHLNRFSIRGTEIAIYDYAHYNEKILNNKSIIVVPSNFREKKDYNGKNIHNDDIYKKFNTRFEMVTYDSLEQLEELTKTHNIDIFYNLKSGENDNFSVSGVKNINHCVFTYDQNNAHGDIYIPISSTIVPENMINYTPYVPHIVNLPLNCAENLRTLLNIPLDAIVFGRHGGWESFNIDFVKETIGEVINRHNIYFVFLNTEPFIDSNKVIFLNETADVEYKTKFINTCDVMIHARVEGESFGFSIAEFSVLNKPIITFWDSENKNPKHHHHIDVLQNSGLYYKNKDELYTILTTFKKETKFEDKYYNLYSPEIVMKKFDEYIIKQKNSVYNFTKDILFDRKQYTVFLNDNLGKSLSTKNGWEPHVYRTIDFLLSSNSNSIFLDIGSNIGYHTIRVAGNYPQVSVLSIEPQKDLFNLLLHNVIQNNLDNVKLFNFGVSSTEESGSIPQLLFSNNNYGDLTSIKNYDKSYNSIKLAELNSIKQHIEKNISVIKLDVSGNELDVLKSMIDIIEEFRPYIILPLESHVCEKMGYTCNSIKCLLSSIDYEMIEIHSEYPCDHLCAPREKIKDMETMFFNFIENNTPNKINDNFNLGITKTIKYPQRLLCTEKKTTVKLICNWLLNEDIQKLWSRMSKTQDGQWNNIQLTLDKIADYYVIINKPHFQNEDECFFEPNKTIVFRMEPDSVTSNNWNQWYSQKEDFMNFMELTKFRNNSEWHLCATYEELIDPRNDLSKFKSQTLSTVLSSLYHMEGHKKRIDFVKYLQRNNVEIDVFGKDNKFEFKNHKGELPSHNKNLGIIPYKYTFIAENCNIDNYFTEKIIDAILGETLCFYWGCDNIEKFIDKNSFIRLDLDNFETSMNIVIESIKNNEWEKRLEFIKKEKIKILNHYSFFPRIEGLIKLNSLKSVVVNLDKRTDRLKKFSNESKRVSFKNYTRFSAVNGINLSRDISEFRNFEKFTQRVPKLGEIGCAMSHLEIWKNSILENKDTLVLEDDVWFDEHFVDKLAMIYNHTNDFDILFLGYHLNNDFINDEKITIDKEKMVINMKDIPVSSDHMFGYYGGGTFGYIVSSKGAKKLISSVNQTGFICPVDYYMLLLSKPEISQNALNIYCSTERIIFSECYDPLTNSGDTDVQK